jgi:hypothetical protein
LIRIKEGEEAKELIPLPAELKGDLVPMNVFDMADRVTADSEFNPMYFKIGAIKEMLADVIGYHKYFGRKKEKRLQQYCYDEYEIEPRPRLMLNTLLSYNLGDIDDTGQEFDTYYDDLDSYYDDVEAMADKDTTDTLYLPAITELKLINYIQYHFIYCLLRKNAAKLLYYRDKAITYYYRRYSSFVLWKTVYKHIMKREKTKYIVNLYNNQLKQKGLKLRKY